MPIDETRLAEIRERIKSAIDAKDGPQPNMGVINDVTWLLAAIDALRAACAWTDATPATMPPAGSGPWLVGFSSHPEVAKLWVGSYGGLKPCWVSDKGIYYADIEDSRWCALPMEPRSPVAELSDALSAAGVYDRADVTTEEA